MFFPSFVVDHTTRSTSLDQQQQYLQDAHHNLRLASPPIQTHTHIHTERERRERTIIRSIDRSIVQEIERERHCKHEAWFCDNDSSITTIVLPCAGRLSPCLFAGHTRTTTPAPTLVLWSVGTVIISVSTVQCVRRWQYYCQPRQRSR